jgi:hypothetical protein
VADQAALEGRGDGEAGVAAAAALEVAVSLYEEKGCVVCSARVRERIGAVVA